VLSTAVCQPFFRSMRDRTLSSPVVVSRRAPCFRYESVGAKGLRRLRQFTVRKSSRSSTNLLADIPFDDTDIAIGSVNHHGDHSGRHGESAPRTANRRTAAVSDWDWIAGVTRSSRNSGATRQRGRRSCARFTETAMQADLSTADKDDPVALREAGVHAGTTVYLAASLAGLESVPDPVGHRPTARSRSTFTGAGQSRCGLQFGCGAPQRFRQHADTPVNQAENLECV
jgi:hypothetical protein